VPEGPVLRFAWLSAVPLMLLYQSGYPTAAITTTPVILLFTGSVLISRLLLSIPAPVRLFGFLRPAAPARAPAPAPAPAR